MRCLSLAAFVLFAASAFAQPAVFKAGFAERDITPDIGMEAPGGYGKSYHRTLHDPCKVRAAVFDDGKNIVALVGIDALGLNGHHAESSKGHQCQTGIPEHAILLGACTRILRALHGVSCPTIMTASELVKTLTTNPPPSIRSSG